MQQLLHPQALTTLPGHRELFVQRLDQIPGSVGGNKWFKLKYNVQAAIDQKANGLLTFGGAYSNHIFATAAAGYRHNLPTIGLIRGELVKPLNPTLKKAREWGMQLKPISREQYRQKDHPSFLDMLNREYPGFYVLPEGGSNKLAVNGCRELVIEGYDYWCVSCGTGGTLGGMITSSVKLNEILGFPALKGAEFLNTDIVQLVGSKNIKQDWQLILDYHFGGYARFNEKLLHWMRNFQLQYGIELDPIYTGKLFYGVFDLALNSFFPQKSKIVLVHSGGLQGNEGFREKYGKNVF